MVITTFVQVFQQVIICYLTDKTNFEVSLDLQILNDDVVLAIALIAAKVVHNVSISAKGGANLMLVLDYHGVTNDEHVFDAIVLLVVYVALSVAVSVSYVSAI